MWGTWKGRGEHALGHAHTHKYQVVIRHIDRQADGQESQDSRDSEKRKRKKIS